MKDQDILNQIAIERNHSLSTIKNYKVAVKIYTKFQGKTLYELLKEAEKEEDDGIKWKNRKLKERLVNYRTYLYATFKQKTAKQRLSIIETIYRHYEIEIHPLPFFSIKNVRESSPITYSDLLTREELQDALKISSPIMSALILFMSSSGCSRTETVNLTVQDFIDATKDYHNSDDIYEVLNTLKDKDNIVPIFYLKRQKTNKHYYTFCSPEATEAIVNYLFTLKTPIFNTHRLFKTCAGYLSMRFTDINDSLNLGKVGDYNKLRPHMLRKYHASNLKNGDNRLNLEEINFLQGRSKGQVNESYFFEDPEKLKQKYISALDDIMVMNVVKELTFDSPEVLLVRKENEKLKEENLKIRDEIQSEARKVFEDILRENNIKL